MLFSTNTYNAVQNASVSAGHLMCLHPVCAELGRGRLDNQFLEIYSWSGWLPSYLVLEKKTPHCWLVSVLLSQWIKNKHHLSSKNLASVLPLISIYVSSAKILSINEVTDIVLQIRNSSCKNILAFFKGLQICILFFPIQRWFPMNDRKQIYWILAFFIF